MATKSLNLDEFIDNNKDASYQEIIDEIIKYQDRMCSVDCKARKAYSKKSSTEEEKEKYKKLRKEIRQEVIKEMENTTLLTRLLTTINNVSKAVKSIAKMVIYTISAIFSVEGVKEVLNNETLSIMEQIYDKSLKVYKFVA